MIHDNSKVNKTSLKARKVQKTHQIVFKLFHSIFTPSIKTFESVSFSDFPNNEKYVIMLKGR